MNLTAIGVDFGLATAMDTMCSQAYGAGNPKSLASISRGAAMLLLEWWSFEIMATCVGLLPNLSSLSACIRLIAVIMIATRYLIPKLFVSTMQYVLEWLNPHNDMHSFTTVTASSERLIRLIKDIKHNTIEGLNDWENQTMF
ncbi:unnamed protein product [Peronospora farinosa]|uniref:Uncharacterized protein n=1 Tax=Peronospora farinosa TaxID=134698 RepID=A0ABN8BVC9_9STRA|nr:unnamed protein product [Peronospora farinosa]